MKENGAQSTTSQLLPSKRRWQRTRKILSLILVFILTSYIGLWVFIQAKIYKLRHMLTDLKSLKPDISSFEDARRIGRKYGADEPEDCTREKCTLVMKISWCNPEVIPTNHIDNRVFNRLGIHFWRAEGWIEVEQNKVTSYGAEIGVEGPDSQHRWHEATWTLFEEIPTINESDQKQFLRNFNPKRDRSPDFLVNWTNSPIADQTEWLWARIGIRATDRQKHAEDFNLKCLTKRGDCSSVCELLPGAARYYNEGLSPTELTFPHPRCN